MNAKKYYRINVDLNATKDEVKYLESHFIKATSHAKALKIANNIVENKLWNKLYYDVERIGMYEKQDT